MNGSQLNADEFIVNNDGGLTQAGRNLFVASRVPNDMFNVVILYSYDAVTAQIMETYARVQQTLWPSQLPEIHIWLLDLLEEPELLSAASQDLSTSDMIVVDANDDRVASEVFHRWAESWPAASEAEPRALVAFQPEGERRQNSHDSAGLEFLRGLAARKRMDFITNEQLPAQNRSRISIACEVPPKSGTRSRCALCRKTIFGKKLEFRYSAILASTNDQ